MRGRGRRGRRSTRFPVLDSPAFTAAGASRWPPDRASQSADSAHSARERSTAELVRRALAKPGTLNIASTRAAAAPPTIALPLSDVAVGQSNVVVDFCAFDIKTRFWGEPFRSRMTRSGRLSRSHEFGQSGHCAIRTTGLVCPTATDKTNNATHPRGRLTPWRSSTWSEAIAGFRSHEKTALSARLSHNV
jgi:hypothetical protein